MSDSLPPLPDDLAQLFARANAEPEREELLANVRDGISRTMILRGIPGFGPDDPGGGGGGSGGAGGAGASSGAGATVSAGSVVVAKTLAVKMAAIAATAGLAIGLGAGHEWGARQRRDGAPIVVADADSAPRADVYGERSVDVGSLPSVPVLIDAGVAVTARSVTSTAPKALADVSPIGRSPLRRERELVDGAAGALKNGNAQQALDLSDQAARQFPDGQLSEEREVIAIEALLALGRRVEARARTERFHVVFPGSPVGARLAAKINSSGP